MKSTDAKAATVAQPVPRSIDEYIAAAPAEVRLVLQAVRCTIRQVAPAAEERISYRMPAYFLDGALVYFAAFKQHVGLYPPVRDPSLQAQLARYAGPKGNLRFPLSEPMPLALIRRVVEARIREQALHKAAAARRPTRSARG
jgi:uncharacterized protein YdhG (YjbR/CyaY superfamily)